MKFNILFRIIISLLGFTFILAACRTPQTTPTIYIPTATPTYIPGTPQPTPTPLFRAAEISFADYGQQLNLLVGDVFELHRFKDDQKPLKIDNPLILQVLGDSQTTTVKLKAVAAGTARVSSLIEYPCPNAPIGCAGPFNFTYVKVIIVSR